MRSSSDGGVVVADGPNDDDERLKTEAKRLLGRPGRASSSASIAKSCVVWNWAPLLRLVTSRRSQSLKLLIWTPLASGRRKCVSTASGSRTPNGSPEMRRS